MRVLVLAGDIWHSIQTARVGLENLEKCGFEFDFIDDIGEFSAERLFQYPLVILSKANQISKTDDNPWFTFEYDAAFGEYVRQGNGMLVIHSGLAGYDHMPILRGLMGGVFVEHPDQCPVTVAPKVDHPLTRGSVPFTVIDEHYFVTVDDDDVDVFLTTTSEHGVQPGGWIRGEGNGRVCVLTPSHNKEGWLHPSFQTLLLNALNWCGRLGFRSNSVTN